MAAHINTLVKQAFCTFASRKGDFAHNLEVLRTMLDRTTGDDLGLPSDHPVFQSQTRQRKAPVTYMNIYEDNVITLGVFVIMENMKLPLHDHPHMHGLIKVLHGRIKVHSFSITDVSNETDLLVESHEPVCLDCADPPRILHPDKENVHEIESVDGVAAILDILAPPYHAYIPGVGQRECNYYRILRQTGNNSVVLRNIDSPSWFWCATLPYAGPRIEKQSQDEELDTSDEADEAEK